MRAFYLLSYDVAEPKRWRRVHRVARDFGEPLQYSVFLCELSEKDKAALEGKLKGIIHEEQDQVMLVRLRATEKPRDMIECFGRPTSVLDRDLLIY